MAETRKRTGELQRAVLQVLTAAADGRAAKEVIAEVAELYPPTAYEAGSFPASPDVPRFTKIVRFDSIGLVKAGWMVKDSGTWRVTDAGREALTTWTDPEAFTQEVNRLYNEWKHTHEDEAEDELAALGATLPGGDGGSVARGWLVRGANVAGVNRIPDWIEHGYASLSFNDVREIPPGTPRKTIAAWVEEDAADASPGARGITTRALDTFVNRIKVGDYVVTVDGWRVYVGEVTSDYFEIDTPGRHTSRRREITWANPTNPLRRADLPAAARSKLAGQLTVSSLAEQTAVFANLAGIDLDQDAAAIDPAASATLPAATGELAADLLLDQTWLDELIDVWDERRQVVLYGPPGTGKTYLARALAEHVAGEDAVTLVQFHPAYGYEDFFEGFRPRAGEDGSVGFELVQGPLRRLAEAARDNPAQPYVLIVDEINRANLAKVFGELYFLLEYRDQAVSLMYSPGEEFTLPANVYLIGTMNTADRSIALVDSAMRRRFAFFALEPDKAPCEGLLRRWLQARGAPSTSADLLDALNAEIGNVDFQVGPSYFMRDSAQIPDGMARVWRNSILPLLAEHHIGDGIDVEARYAIDTLLVPVAAPAES